MKYFVTNISINSKNEAWAKSCNETPLLLLHCCGECNRSIVLQEIHVRAFFYLKRLWNYVHSAYPFLLALCPLKMLCDMVYMESLRNFSLTSYVIGRLFWYSELSTLYVEMLANITYFITNISIKSKNGAWAKKT